MSVVHRHTTFYLYNANIDKIPSTFKILGERNKDEDRKGRNALAHPPTRARKGERKSKIIRKKIEDENNPVFSQRQRTNNYA